MDQFVSFLRITLNIAFISKMLIKKNKLLKIGEILIINNFQKKKGNLFQMLYDFDIFDLCDK